MEITLKLNKDFERALDVLKEEYGEDFEKFNGFHESNLNYSDFIDGFIDKNKKAVADTTIDGNANATSRDICSMMGERSKPEDKVFTFNKIFYELKKKYGLKTAKEWLHDEWTGAYYLHDAHTATFKPYCYAYDLTRLATEGEFFLKNNYNAEPAHHLDTFIDHVIEFVGYMSNRSSGAVGLPDLLVWTYYFWKKDVASGHYMKSPEYYIEQEFQKLVYRLNQQFLRVDQSAFTNMSIFDKYYAEALFGGRTYPDGSFFIDDVPGFIEHEKVFMKVVAKIRKENMFTFPVLTMSILKRNDITQEEIDKMTKTRNWNVFKDNDFARWCSDHNTIWYDSNMFMSDNVGTLSNCCRLLSDTSKLTKADGSNVYGNTTLSIEDSKDNDLLLDSLLKEFKNNLFNIRDDETIRNKFLSFVAEKNLKISEVEYIKHKVAPDKMTRFFNSIGGNLSIGSIKVNTINLMRIALESEKDEKKYLSILKKRTLLCCKTLDTIRHIITRNIEKGLLPNYCEGGIDMAKQYCTIGILGLYEVIKDFGYIKIDNFGMASYTDEGIEFAKKIFDVINDVKDNFECDYSFNIESVPAERAAVILAQKDRVMFNLKKSPTIYSNQWIPLSQKCTINEKLKTAAVLDNLCSGGAIAHVNIEAGFPSKDAAWEMLCKIALTGVIYFAFNTKIGTCKNNHAIEPGVTACSICGEGIEDVWTRIVGFYRPTSSFSAPRQVEYGTRNWWAFIQELNELAYTK
ncbi:MAG: hypothetical protein HUJ68_10850 [Clostridia bacterium]|nr:hypothetical protein [Clostridia bacterium]